MMIRKPISLLRSVHGGAPIINSAFYYQLGGTKHMNVGTGFNSRMSGSGIDWTWINSFRRGNIGFQEWFIVNWNSQIAALFSTLNQIQCFFATPTGTFSFTSTATFTDVNKDLLVYIVFDDNESGNDKLKMYVNGVLLAGSYSGTPNYPKSSGNNLTLGTGTNGIKGRWNYDAFIERAASASEITSHYNGGAVKTFGSVWGSDVWYEHLVDNDTWNGANFDMLDEKGNITTGVTQNMLITDKVAA